jgi:hypothetical protein
MLVLHLTALHTLSFHKEGRTLYNSLLSFYIVIKLEAIFKPEAW